MCKRVSGSLQWWIGFVIGVDLTLVLGYVTWLPLFTWFVFSRLSHSAAGGWVAFRVRPVRRLTCPQGRVLGRLAGWWGVNLGIRSKKAHVSSFGPGGHRLLRTGFSHLDHSVSTMAFCRICVRPLQMQYSLNLGVIVPLACTKLLMGSHVEAFAG